MERAVCAVRGAAGSERRVCSSPQSARRGARDARTRGAGKCGMERAGSSGAGIKKDGAARREIAPARGARASNAAVRRPYGAGVPTGTDVPAVPAGVDAAPAGETVPAGAAVPAAGGCVAGVAPAGIALSV